MLEASKTGRDTGRLIDVFNSVLEIWSTRSCQMGFKLPDYVGYADMPQMPSLVMQEYIFWTYVIPLGYSYHIVHWEWDIALSGKIRC